MPKAYEAMRDKFIAKGMSTKAAKTKAAKIYNSQHPKAPVTRASDSDSGPPRRSKWGD